jgi:hypothetical protein
LNVASKCNSSFDVNTADSLYPTHFFPEDVNVIVTTSNVSTYAVGSYKARALSALMQNKQFAGAMLQLNTAAAITDSSTTQIFVMEGANSINKCPITRPLKVILANGWQVVSTHMCDIHIGGLPFVLTKHIITGLINCLPIWNTSVNRSRLRCHIQQTQVHCVIQWKDYIK